MSFENPTSVKVGMTGTFSGITYRVLGRVVMGVVDDGTTYYWNEFNLKADSGESTTLVYEVTDNGGEWRLFTMFEPQFPITAADAATKRIGDPLNLDGTAVRVTLRDNSRVYHIEGQAPEGVDLGDRAEYFNAEAGKTMIVVSWTGDEVECYHGVTISASVVAQAFNIPAASLASMAPGLSNFTFSRTDSPRKLFLPLIAGAALLILFFCLALPPRFSKSQALAIVMIPAPSANLAVGSSGTLEGKNYTITSDTLVELNEVGVLFQRHEFHLRDQDGNGALLVRGWMPGATDWALFVLRDAPESLTPQQAAAVPCGQTVAWSGATVPVNALFRSTVLQVNTADILQSATGHVSYGLSGGTEVTLLLARWDDSTLNLYEGHLLHEDPAGVFLAPPASR